MKIKFEVYPKPQKIKANKIITLLTNIDDEMLDHRIRYKNMVSKYTIVPPHKNNRLDEIINQIPKPKTEDVDKIIADVLNTKKFHDLMSNEWNKDYSDED